MPNIASKISDEAIGIIILAIILVLVGGLFAFLVARFLVCRKGEREPAIEMN